MRDQCHTLETWCPPSMPIASASHMREDVREPDDDPRDRVH